MHLLFTMRHNSSIIGLEHIAGRRALFFDLDTFFFSFKSRHGHCASVKES